MLQPDVDAAAGVVGVHRDERQRHADRDRDHVEYAHRHRAARRREVVVQQHVREEAGHQRREYGRDGGGDPRADPAGDRKPERRGQHQRQHPAQRRRSTAAGQHGADEERRQGHRVRRDGEHQLDVIMVGVQRPGVGAERETLDELMGDEAEVAELLADAVGGDGSTRPAPQPSTEQGRERWWQRECTDEEQQRDGAQLLDRLGQQLQRCEGRDRRDREGPQRAQPHAVARGRGCEHRPEQHGPERDEQRFVHRHRQRMAGSTFAP